MQIIVNTHGSVTRTHVLYYRIPLPAVSFLGAFLCCCCCFCGGCGGFAFSAPYGLLRGALRGLLGGITTMLPLLSRLSCLGRLYGTGRGLAFSLKTDGIWWYSDNVKLGLLPSTRSLAAHVPFYRVHVLLPFRRKLFFQLFDFDLIVVWKTPAWKLEYLTLILLSSPLTRRGRRFSRGKIYVLAEVSSGIGYGENLFWLNTFMLHSRIPIPVYKNTTRILKLIFKNFK